MSTEAFSPESDTRSVVVRAPLAARLATPLPSQLSQTARQQLPDSIPQPADPLERVAVFKTVPARYAAYQEILSSGLRTQADVNLALDLIALLHPTLAQLVEIYRKAPVPVHFIKEAQSAYVERKSIDGPDRITSYAEGIFLGAGSELFVFIHELTHAIPFAVLTEKSGWCDSPQHILDKRPYTWVYFPDDPNLKYRSTSSMCWVRVVRPESLFSPTSLFNSIHRKYATLKYDRRVTPPTLSDLFTRLVGNYCCDEAASALAEVLLLEVLREQGFIVWACQELEAGLEIIKQQRAIRAEPNMAFKAFYSNDFYLGDNHFLFYNARALYFVAEQVMKDPDRLKEFSWSSRIDLTGFNLGDQNVALDIMRQIDPQEVLRVLKETISRPLSEGDSLLPMQIRLRRYLAAMGVSRFLFDGPDRESRTEPHLSLAIDFGTKRPTPIKGCDDTRIDLQAMQTVQRVTLSGAFVDFLNRLLAYSDREIVMNLEAYARLAELCDPALSPKLYRQLYALLFSNRHEQQTAIVFALSCLRSGYEDIGKTILLRTLCEAKVITEGIDLKAVTKAMVGPIVGWEERWNLAVVELVRQGHGDVARLLLMGVEKTCAAEGRNYLKEIKRIFEDEEADRISCLFRGFPELFRKRLTKLARAYAGST
ncbi:MAG TPA: hypothetical protein VJC18_09710, partial [bacterium]|nr:hypothetical protein [bacterium]